MNNIIFLAYNLGIENNAADEEKCLGDSFIEEFLEKEGFLTLFASAKANGNVRQIEFSLKVSNSVYYICILCI